MDGQHSLHFSILRRYFRELCQLLPALRATAKTNLHMNEIIVVRLPNHSSANWQQWYRRERKKKLYTIELAMKRNFGSVKMPKRDTDKEKFSEMWKKGAKEITVPAKLKINFIVKTFFCVILHLAFCSPRISNYRIVLRGHLIAAQWWWYWFCWGKNFCHIISQWAQIQHNFPMIYYAEGQMAFLWRMHINRTMNWHFYIHIVSNWLWILWYRFRGHFAYWFRLNAAGMVWLQFEMEWIGIRRGTGSTNHTTKTLETRHFNV